MKRNADSTLEISTSERPCSTGISADLRWCMRFLAYAAYEKQTLLGLGLLVVISGNGSVVAACCAVLS